jgi:hypothetical protein
MAATEGFGARAVSRLIGWLAVPRVVTFPILIALGLGLAQLAWHFVDSVKILAWASGMASPFCMLCATAVWAMRDRIDDAVDTELMSASEYRQFEQLVSTHRTRSSSWAAVTAVMALLASGPAVSNQLIGPIWHGMVLVSGAAIGCSTYAYLLANYWENQIRAHKGRQRLLEKQRRERERLLEEMRAGAGTLRGSGWVEGPPLNQPTRHQH